MSSEYRSLKLFVRFGAYLAILVAAGVLAIFVGIFVQTGGENLLWPAVGLCAAVFVWFLMIIMRDLVRVILETLVPSA
jgi:hypothetical protein